MQDNRKSYVPQMDSTAYCYDWVIFRMTKYTWSSAVKAFGTYQV